MNLRSADTQESGIPHPNKKVGRDFKSFPDMELNAIFILVQKHLAMHAFFFSFSVTLIYSVLSRGSSQAWIPKAFCAKAHLSSNSMKVLKSFSDPNLKINKLSQ